MKQFKAELEDHYSDDAFDQDWDSHVSAATAKKSILQDSQSFKEEILEDEFDKEVVVSSLPTSSKKSGHTASQPLVV